MSTIPPIYFVWETDNRMRPLDHFSRLAESSFTAGHVYRMIADGERSGASHNHFMATVHEAFLNLPPKYARKIKNETHLRKYALIQAGFYDLLEHIATNEADAILFERSILKREPYALVIRGGAVVACYFAKSQRLAAHGGMSRREFERSVEDVFHVLSKMIGTSVDELREAGKRAA